MIKNEIRGNLQPYCPKKSPSQRWIDRFHISMRSIAFLGLLLILIIAFIPRNITPYPDPPIPSDDDSVAALPSAEKQTGDSEVIIMEDIVDLIQTTDGGFALTITTASSSTGDTDILLVKTDENGTVQWSKSYGQSSYDEAGALFQTPDGGYALFGQMWSVSLESSQTSFEGKAYVIFGRATNRWVMDQSLSEANLTILGGSQFAGTNSRFATHVSGIGDINDDGYADFSISAPWVNNRQGMIFVIFGCEDLSCYVEPTTTTEVSTTTTEEPTTTTEEPTSTTEESTTTTTETTTTQEASPSWTFFIIFISLTTLLIFRKRTV